MEVCDAVIDHPSAWKGSDFASKDDIAFDLEPRHLDAFARAMDKIRRQGLGLDDVERAHFEVPEIAGELAALLREIQDGRGLVLVRGFPLADYTEDEIGIIYWGIGTHLGVGVSQSVMGDRLGHVADFSKDDPNARAYRNKQELSLHTDMSDIISLLSLQKSARGGLSRLASIVAIHNEMLLEHPEHLAVLYRGFPYHRIGEEAPGDSPVTPWNVPVFSYLDGLLSARYVRECILAGAKLEEREIPEDEMAALDCFNAIANREDVVYEFQLEPGEAMFVNNFLVLHARTAFEDDEDAGLKRHLLRLWLDVPGGRPYPETMNIYGTTGIAFQEGKTPSYAGKAYEELLNS
jgi:hypothetical protein